MYRIATALIILACVATASLAYARGGGGSSGGHTSSQSTSSTGSSHAAHVSGGASHSGSHASSSAGRSHAAHASGGGRTRHATSKTIRPHTSHASAKAAAGVKRDSHGKIARSQQAKSDFKHQKPCPSTGKSTGACPGYVIDHVVALKRGGADAPSNIQWQQTAAAKQKDKWE